MLDRQSVMYHALRSLFLLMFMKGAPLNPHQISVFTRMMKYNDKMLKYNVKL